MSIKTIKLNKYNDKLLGAAVFLGGELLAPFVGADDTHICIEIEEVETGILIRPLKAIELRSGGGSTG